MFICATKIIVGGSNTLVLAKDGKVYGAGCNVYERSHETNQKTFVEITFLRNINIREIIAGGSHTLALANDGKVYGEGRNDRGQLGLGHTKTQKTFVEITSLKNINIRKIIVGLFHTLALAKDGKVYGAGYNYFGQLGIGNIRTQETFVEIISLRNINIRKIVAGESHTLVLANDGRVYGAGCNEYDLSHATDQKTFVEIISLRNINIREIIAGELHTLALAKDGKVYGAGRHYRGQLGLGNKGTQNTFVEIPSLRNINIREIIAGSNHTLALANDGRVYGTGYNEDGQLGLGHTTDQNTFVEITSLRNINIRKIIAGCNHTLALAKDGNVYGTGLNFYGQLGLGNNCKKEKVLKFTLIPNIRVIYPLPSLQKKLWKQETDRKRIDTIIITKW